MPVLQVPAGEEGGPGGFPNLRKEEYQEEDEEEEEGILKFPSVPLATRLLHLQLLLQGAFHQDEVKQPDCRNTQRPKLMNFWGLLRTQITCNSTRHPSLFSRTV